MSNGGLPGSAHRIWAAVPFRGPAGSKRRLAGLFDASERERLSVAMLADVLDVLLANPSVERVLVVTPTTEGHVWPDHQRLSVVKEPRPTPKTGDVDGLNRSIRHAQDLAQRGGAKSVLIVPSDLPLFGSGDLVALLEAGAEASVVAAPDRASEGTNALLVSPPTAIMASFGTASYARHLRLAEAAGLRTSIVDAPGLRLDLDTPADVLALLAQPTGGRASRLLRDIDAAARLATFEPSQARSTTI